MDKGYLGLLYVILLYILRCLVPLGIMLGISYLLRRFGLIREVPRPPKGWNNNQDNAQKENSSLGGGLAHG